MTSIEHHHEAAVVDGSVRRLGEELEEDGIILDVESGVHALVLEELNHARRVQMFEGRRPFYGSFVLGGAGALKSHAAEFDVVDLSVLDLAAARTYADGRAAYLIRRQDTAPMLACFERLLQYEIEIVRVQEATGAQIVQRTTNFGVPRLFTDGAIVAWNGNRWEHRPTANAVLPSLQRAAPQLAEDVARNALELAIHWLSPARIGATLVVFEDEIPWPALDTATATRAPALSIVNRRHFPALFAALHQHDLATVVSADGLVRKIGVGLRFSASADANVSADRGMRHRSAQRFSYDHPTATLVVVSEDGPVTVFRNGFAI
jgi:DNA integrity scanning protein DisA with diadenylate cyclase activity